LWRGTGPLYAGPSRSILRHRTPIRRGWCRLPTRYESETASEQQRSQTLLLLGWNLEELRVLPLSFAPSLATCTSERRSLFPLGRPAQAACSLSFLSAQQWQTGHVGARVVSNSTETPADQIQTALNPHQRRCVRFL
jgi:hypothetical protein